MTIPTRVRFWIYIATGIGTLLVGYLQAKGYIAEAEIVLWTGLAALVNGLSAWNAREVKG